MFASKLDLTPLRLDNMDFIFSDNIVATEVMTTAELIESVSEEAAVDSAFDTDCGNDACAP